MKQRWILPAAFGLALILRNPGGGPIPAADFRPAGRGAGHEENNLHVGLASGFGFAFPDSRLAATVEIDHWSTEPRNSFGKLRQGRLAVTPRAGRSPVANSAETAILFPTSPPGPDTSNPFPDRIARPRLRIPRSGRMSAAGARLPGLGASWRLSPLWEFFSEIDYLIRTAPGRTITRHPGGALSQADLWVNLHVVYWKFGLRFLF